jgi:homoserine kinase
VRWWDCDDKLFFPAASSSPPLARRTAVAAGGGGTAVAGSGPSPLVFCFLNSFEKLFAESLKILTAHHCREHELQLTA